MTFRRKLIRCALYYWRDYVFMVMLCTYVNFTRVNKMEAMYGISRVNVKVERDTTFACTRDLPHNTSNLFTRLKFTRQWKSTLMVHFLCRVIFTCVGRADKCWAVKRALRSSFNVWCGVGLARALFPLFRCAWRPAKFSFLQTGNPIFFL